MVTALWMQIVRGVVWVWGDSSPAAAQEAAQTDVLGDDIPGEVDGQVHGGSITDLLLMYRELPCTGAACTGIDGSNM
jgi:hypothetical protein